MNSTVKIKSLATSSLTVVPLLHEDEYKNLFSFTSSAFRTNDSFIQFKGNDDNLFSGNTSKKESKADGSKKTNKASRTVTDDELFGDSGSIFDVPSKAKEKKKKKADGGSEGKSLFPLRHADYLHSASFSFGP